MRKVTPSSNRRPGYPKLARGWRILVAAPLAFSSLAHGDATVPDHGDKGPGKGKKEQKPEPPPVTIPDYPILGGAVAAPEPPMPPEPPKKKEKPKKPTGMILHPHGPDEPCMPIDGGKKLA
jgi:hypothetical protein